MLATITAHDGGTARVEVEGPWSLSEKGGWVEATLTCKVLPFAVERLLAAEIVVDGPTRPAFMGHVRAVEGTTLSCGGWQARLADYVRGGAYISRIVEWDEYAPPATATPWFGESIVATDGLQFAWRKGKTYPANYIGGAIRYYPLPDEVTTATFPFSWSRYNQTDYIIEVGPYVVLADGSLSFGSTWATPVGSGGTSGTQSLTITNGGAPFVGIYVGARPAVSVTPGADTYAYVTGISVKGTSVATPNPVTVSGDLFDAAPDLTSVREVATSGASVAAYSDFVVPLGPVLDGLAEVIKSGAVQVHFRPRLVGGAWKAAAIVRDRPSAPIYRIVEGRGEGGLVSCDLSPLSLDSLVRTLYVRWQTPQGVQRTTVVEDTDIAHPLVAYDIDRAEIYESQATTVSDATADGVAALVEKGRRKWTGSIRVEGLAGGIAPCELVPGELVEVVTRDRGTITTRITGLECDDPYNVTVLVDDGLPS